jgi:isopenicillin N synthase-like dioxygenase
MNSFFSNSMRATVAAETAAAASSGWADDFAACFGSARALAACAVLILGLGGFATRQALEDWADLAAFVAAPFALEAAGSRILEAIAVGLGLPRDGFAAAVFEGNSVLRLLHYPPVAEGARGVRAAAHADINVITLLLGADEAGLELLSADGVWLTVEAPPGTLVCNVGDMLERKTGGRLPSTRHRVVNPVGPRGLVSRVSMPFFLHFRPDHLIVPDPPRADMPPILAHDFLLQRLREIRLSHDGSA